MATYRHTDEENRMAETIGYGQRGYGQGYYGGYMVKTTSVSLTLEEKGKMTVTVEDPGGNALSGVSVTLSGTQSQSGETGSNGKVIFDGIQIGDYTVEASKDGYFAASTQVSAGDFS